ncbi:ABC transporter substrate-binding protein [Bartonella sp. HY761]|uniref:ABC transporter substrate-binding protein n=1 Tax=Bartonella sp. HY761 TaxID=2979330 RepID=UPI002207D2F3|nr:ABC transporter substrate-binding protein [Bartonella sp. HY761]UXN06757.1 ABC transporter substrate-binding protein [Bartonella sp. HY761]
MLIPTSSFFQKVLTLSSLVILPLIVLNNTAEAASTQYPLKLNNCGRVIEFKKKPQNVVSVGQTSTEILYLLGLSDKVKGTALWFEPVMPEFKDIDAQIKRLADNEPSFESVVAQKPDMIANQYEWTIGPVGATATYSQFDDLTIPVYTSPADCEGKDNLAGNDGLRTTPFDMDIIYKEIHELSQIFDVEERGDKVIETLKAREKVAIEKAKSLNIKDISGIMWFSSSTLQADPFIGGRLGAPAYIFKTLNIKNIAQSDFDWPTMGWETIAKDNPTVLVIADMQRKRFPADHADVKINFLQGDPVTKLMSAVKDQRIITINAQAMNGSIHTIDGIEQLADALIKIQENQMSGAKIAPNNLH